MPKKSKRRPAINRNQISLAGEFAVLSQLSVMGYDANMTLGNTKGVDILVSAPKGKMYRLEVKTRYNAKPSRSGLFGLNFSWQLSKKNETIIDSKLFYCFVNMTLNTQEFRFFIVPSKIVAQYVKRENKIWLKDNPTHKATDMRQFRLGFKDEIYKAMPNTQLVDIWENNWKFNFK